MLTTLAPRPAAAQNVPLSDFLAQYAPADLRLIKGDPLTVTVGGVPLAFADKGTDTEGRRVYAGTVRQLTITARFAWHSAAQAMTWDIALANAGTAREGPIVVTPLKISLDGDVSGGLPAVPCTKYYNGAVQGQPFTGNATIFATTSVAPTVVRELGAGTYVPLLQIALSKQPTNVARACDEQMPNSLAGLYMGLSWSAGWTMSAGWGPSEGGHRPPFVITTAIANPGGPTPDTTNIIYLDANQSVDYPTVNLGFATGFTWNDIEHAQVNYVRTVLQPKLPGQLTASPLSYDTYFGVAGTPPLHFLRQQAKQSAALGVKYFIIDAGWYQADETGDQFPGLGNSLTPAIMQYPQGQTDMADFCRNYLASLGMKCAIWLVPQATSSVNTDAIKQGSITDWAFDKGYGPYKLQLQNRSAQDSAVAFLAQVVDTYGIDWIRLETQALGTYITPISPYTDIAYNNGITEVFRRLRALRPNVFIEASQGGGQRMEFNTARLAHGNWLKDFSIYANDSRGVQTRGLRLWPSSFLNLSDVGCTPEHTFYGPGCAQSGGGTNGIFFDNVGDQWKVISRMPGKLSFDGYISQWSEANTLKIRGLTALFNEVSALQEERVTFPLPQAQGESWDAVAFGGAASPAGVTPVYPASAGQALYVFRGVDAATSKTFCLSRPALGYSNIFTMASGPATGASIVYVGPCAPGSGNYIAGGDSFTVTLPQSSGALFLRGVVPRTVPEPSRVRGVQNDQTIRVTWINGDGAIAGSEISRSADNGTTWSVIGATHDNETRYIDAAIAPGATYLYRVAAYDSSVTQKSKVAVSPAVIVQSAPTTTTVYDTDPTIHYSAGAVALRSLLSPMPSAYGTAHDLPSGATATYTCRQCSRLAWNSRPGLATANRKATVTLADANGTIIDTVAVDTSGPAALTSRAVYDSGPLIPGTYKLTITADPDCTVAVDSIDVRALVPTLTDDAATPPPGDKMTYSNAPPHTNLGVDRGYFGDTAHSGMVDPVSFAYSCADCTEIRWLAHTGPDFGMASIALDGGKPVVVNAEAPVVSKTSSVLYSTGPLPLGQHTVTFSKATGKWLEVDAFQVIRPQPGSVASYTVAASGGWTQQGFTFYTPATAPAITAANYYHEEAWSTRTTVSDGSVSVSYTCTQCDRLQLVTGKAANLGIAVVTVKDETGATLKTGTVDLYAPPRPGQSELADSSRLPASVVFDSGLLSGATGKRYTITVRPSGTKNDKATDTWIEVQAVRITRPPVVAAWRTANGGAPPTP